MSQLVTVKCTHVVSLLLRPVLIETSNPCVDWLQIDALLNLKGLVMIVIILRIFLLWVLGIVLNLSSINWLYEKCLYRVGWLVDSRILKLLLLYKLVTNVCYCPVYRALCSTPCQYVSWSLSISCTHWTDYSFYTYTDNIINLQQ